MISHFFNTIEQ